MNEKRVVPIKEAVKFGWEATKKNFKFFLMVFAVLALTNFIPQGINNLWKNQPSFVVFLMVVIFWIIRLITELGLIKISLNLVDSIPAKLEALFSYTNWRILLRFFLASLLYNLMVGVGLILLIVPGVYLALRFQYYSYLIADKNLGVMQAFRESSKLTLGVKWGLFKFGILLGLINILGAIALVIGLLWTVPTSMIAGAYVYRKLLRNLN